MRSKLSHSWTQAHTSNEMTDLWDFDFLNSCDMAAAQAVFDSVATEDNGMMSCSCCTELYGSVQELHFHQSSVHSLEELSLALISLRGMDMQNIVPSIPFQEEIESEHLRGLLFDPMTLKSYDSDDESTITVNSEARLAWMSPMYSGLYEALDKEITPGSGHTSSSSFSDPNSFLGTFLAPQMCDVYCNGHSTIFSDNNNVENQMYFDVNGNTVTKQIKVEAPEVCGSMCESEKEDHGILHHAQCAKGAMAFLEEQVEQHGSLPMPTDWHIPKPSKKSSRRSVSFYLDGDKKSCAQYPKKGSTYKNASSPSNMNTDKKMKTNKRSKTQVKGKKDCCVNSQEVRAFMCFICGKNYKKKSHLHRHMRVHTGEKPYACDLCPKKFGIRSVLKQHIRTHTGEKPFSCSVCFQRYDKFPQKSGLMTHMMLHNGKPFKCQYCVKSFVSNHKLRHHLRIHGQEIETSSRVGQYECSDCAMRFFTVGALMEHCKKHLPEAQGLCQSVQEPQVCVTITKEAARAAVSVLGNGSMQYCNNAVKSEFGYGMLPEEMLSGDLYLMDNFLHDAGNQVGHFHPLKR